MEFSELADLIKSRRSIRRWQDKPVPEELLLKAIELATWAPNGGNQQNWRFYVILNQNTITKIADAVYNSANLISSFPAAEKLGAAARIREGAGFFRSAPAAIAVAASRYQSIVDQVLAAEEMKEAKAARIREWRNIADSRIQSVSSSIAYLLLVLHQMGLGAVWMTGPMQVKEEIEKLLKVPKEMDVVTFIPVGYPAEKPAPRERKPVKEVTEVVR